MHATTLVERDRGEAMRGRVVRLGWLTATPDFLAAVPREAFSMALRTHQHADAVEGEPFQTRHSCPGTVFAIQDQRRPVADGIPAGRGAVGGGGQPPDRMR